MTFDIFSFHMKKQDDTVAMKNDIAFIKKQLEIAKNRFENESDSDLVDSCIFEINSLQAKYRYLLKLAKQKNKAI